MNFNRKLKNNFLESILSAALVLRFLLGTPEYFFTCSHTLFVFSYLLAPKRVE